MSKHKLKFKTNYKVTLNYFLVFLSGGWENIYIPFKMTRKCLYPVTRSLSQLIFQECPDLSGPIQSLSIKWQNEKPLKCKAEWKPIRFFKFCQWEEKHKEEQFDKILKNPLIKKKKENLKKCISKIPSNWFNRFKIFPLAHARDM